MDWRKLEKTVRVVGKATAILLVTLFYRQTCPAQVDTWGRVKLIERGKAVRVKLHSGKTVKGKVESWSLEGLSVRHNDGIRWHHDAC